MGARMHSVDMETRHGAGNYLRSLENRIRERAYEIWTARGCIPGQDDQHWLAAEREILTELTATLAVPETGASVARPRAKKSNWRRELRIKFCGMLFGVSIAAVAAFSLGAHHNGGAPASPGPIRESAAPDSAPTVGAEVTAARVEATGVDTDRASTASDVGAHHNGSSSASPGPIRETAAPASAPTVGAEVTAARVEARGVDMDRASGASVVTSGGKSNVATTCEASGAAACGVLVGSGDAPVGTGAGGAWTNVPETPAPATSPRPPASEHIKPVASHRSAAAADRPNTKLGRSHAGDGSSGHNGFWAWSR
jgi:Protein of unknown function (DUF2934)